MRTLHRLALAALLLALSPSPSPANVIYHLDTGQPPGTGLHAEVEFAGPASATSGWTITDPADVVRMVILDVPLVTGFPPRTTVIDVFAGPLPQFFSPFSSSTGAHPDRGWIPAWASLGGLQAFVAFDFGPGGAGSADVDHLDSHNGTDHNVEFSARGTWVLGPATAPEPASWLLAGIACAAGVVVWGVRRSAGA